MKSSWVIEFKWYKSKDVFKWYKSKDVLKFLPVPTLLIVWEDFVVF